MSTTLKRQYGWGIIGCGKISSDFCNVLLSHPRTNIIACAARSISKSSSFAKKFNIPNAYNMYSKVSQHPQVEIVYIGTIHPSHLEAVVTALNNKKHVLCEKPVAMNAHQLQQMINTAKLNCRFFMEGVWFRFSPSIRQARAWIDAGVIGDVTAYFSDIGRIFDGPQILPRIWDKQLGGGALLDIGCYAINPITYVFGERFPDKIVANGIIDKKHGIDVQSAMSFRFGDGDTVQFGQINCTMLTNTINEFTVCGTKGKIVFKRPAHKCTELMLYKYDDLKRKDIVCTEIREYKLPPLKNFKYGFNFRRGQAIEYEIDAVLQCLDKGWIECPEYNWNEMMIIMKFMDHVRRQIGMRYDDDMQSKL